MQPASRTPNSILRKRLDKENEDAHGKAVKRVRGNRRVSFAPADELETKHIFKQDFRDDHPSTAEIDASPVGGLIAAAGAVNPLPTLNAQPEAAQHAGLNLAVLPSPEQPSPLSMDLTNNSFEQQGPVAASMVSGTAAGGDAAGLTLQPSHYQHSHGHHEYTRNITMNVPNLSTLVEEDEEEYDATSGAVDSSNAEASVQAQSPISPFVLREMQRRSHDTEGNLELKNRWGFAPGAEDTMDVNVGHAVMGETTYNNVYGTCTTGDITRAIKESSAGGNHPTGLLEGAAGRGAAQPTMPARAAAAGAFGRLGSGTDDQLLNPTCRVAALPRADLEAAQRADALGAAAQPFHQTAFLQQQQPGAHASQTLPRQEPLQLPLGAAPPHAPLPQNTPFLDNTTKLLEDDQTWRLPGQGRNYDRGRLSVASNKVLGPAGYRRGMPEGGAGAGAGDPTVTLNPTTKLLATSTMHTERLLEDTTNHKAAYEHFLRGTAARQVQPSPAPAPRPAMRAGHGEATAISSSAAELRRQAAAAAQDNTEMSLELHVGHTAANNDLLGDGGLSLDAFALPPEPSVTLSQQLASGARVQLRAPRPLLPGERGGGGELLHVSSSGRAATAQKITCQEFLTIIDVNFNEKVCRTSYLPQADPPPTSVAEVYEAAAVVAPYVEAYQAMVLSVAARLTDMQSRVQQLEVELSANNPEIFVAVQQMPPLQLESVKDHVISLKKLCRIRTVKSIKQAHLAALDNLLVLMCAARDKLQAELAAVAADVDSLKRCNQGKVDLTAAISRWCQEDERRLQEAAQRKKAAEGHLQRLEALRAQNAERQRRLEEARAERQAIQQNRVPLEVLKKERKDIEERAEALAARCSKASSLTPGRESQMAQKIAAKSEEVDALLGLHSLRLDFSDMDRTGRFNVVFRGVYRIECDTTSGGSCQFNVSLLDGPGKPCRWEPSITAAFGASAAALSCSVPTCQVPMHLEAIQKQLNRMWRLARQLESCWMKYNCMLQPIVEAEEEGRGPTLLLQFQNVVTSARVAIRMPWRAALQSDAFAPPLRVQMKSLDPPETQHEYCDALLASVLSKLPPSTGYVATLCYAMSETLQVRNGAGQTALREDPEAEPLSRTPQVEPLEGKLAGRTFENPLFTFAAA
ncbi:hypothetical protein Agub_g8547 [Astrephomene gubernaculifera]|uniref:Spc7 kinetochore protein domain-containing protein n=1 Tax=Astrephomene gubernaculifera TaxID=47775 RepID=A0AAD3DRW0_9CHLO|nr:hypothetical protein Agub_g8547 [Astrephomene gubernaculifera]